MSIRNCFKTYANLFRSCAESKSTVQLKLLHSQIIQTCPLPPDLRLFIGNGLISLYLKCQEISSARHVFEEMTERNEASWNAIVSGYAKLGLTEEALNLFWSMPQRSVVSWTSVISAYAAQGCREEALKFFQQMQREGIYGNEKTFAGILPVCASLRGLKEGKEIHGEILRRGIEPNVFVGSALVDMYIKCDQTEDAYKVLVKMPDRNLVTWNSMISGYAESGHFDQAIAILVSLQKRNIISWTALISGYVKNGHFNEAIQVYQKMIMRGTKANSSTFASILSASANLAALGYGMALHGDIIKSGFGDDVYVGNGLIDMYAKCGWIPDAHKFFQEMPLRSVVSWTVMILGFSIHGHGKEALCLFEDMKRSGIRPNHVTFLGILSACCNAGLVKDGLKYFDSMTQEYLITPNMKHYCCMVSLLGRAGCLQEAYDFILRMPVVPDAVVWGSLLGACEAHKNVRIGELAAKYLFDLDPNNSANYVLLSNIYAAAGLWDKLQNIRNQMKVKQDLRTPGCSWIEVNNEMHAFHMQDL